MGILNGVAGVVLNEVGGWRCYSDVIYLYTRAIARERKYNMEDWSFLKFCPGYDVKRPITTFRVVNSESPSLAQWAWALWVGCRYKHMLHPAEKQYH
jgi:hypothetical protein